MFGGSYKNENTKKSVKIVTHNWKVDKLPTT